MRVQNSLFIVLMIGVAISVNVRVQSDLSKSEGGPCKQQEQQALTRDEPEEEVFTRDEPEEEVFTRDEPEEEVFTRDEPEEEVFTRDEPEEEVFTRDEPEEELMTEQQLLTNTCQENRQFDVEARSQGNWGRYFINEDLISGTTNPQGQCETVSIRSKSSGLYLNAIHGSNREGIIVMLSEQEPSSGNPYLQWRIESQCDGTYLIRSVSSNLVLDGRNPENQGIELALTNTSGRSGIDGGMGIKYFLWTFEQSEALHYAMHSVSSGNYLDGRGPDNTGIEVMLTSRTAAGDNYLQWEFACTP